MPKSLKPEDWNWTQHNTPPAPAFVVHEKLEIGRLYGPNGELIKIIREHEPITFGFGN